MLWANNFTAMASKMTPKTFRPEKSSALLINCLETTAFKIGFHLEMDMASLK